MKKRYIVTMVMCLVLAGVLASGLIWAGGHTSAAYAAAAFGA